jgi:hypothetical protein
MTNRGLELNRRFWSKVCIKGACDCWEWSAAVNDKGYGRFSYKGKSERAHRVAFILSGGMLTTEKPYVLHHCDNPLCVNPKHLFSGNMKDNTQDMMKKSRQNNAIGEKASKAKLTTQEVLEIRYLCKNHIMTRRTVAKLYNVFHSTVNAIHARQTWIHI